MAQVNRISTKIFRRGGQSAVRLYLIMAKGIRVYGKKLAGIRESLYLTQEKMAMKLGYAGAGSYRRVELCEVGGMHSEHFVLLAELLKISPDELERRIGVHKHPTVMILDAEPNEPNTPPSSRGPIAPAQPPRRLARDPQPVRREKSK